MVAALPRRPRRASGAVEIRTSRSITGDVKALRATLSIAFGALFFAAGLALGDFTGTVLMGLGAAAFLGAIS
jgi:hypothetical protein